MRLHLECALPALRGVLAVLAAWAAFGGCPAPVLAQHVENGTVGGLQPALPVVPPSFPRPAEGKNDAEMFHLQPDKAPTASFIDSLKRSDAALEVIVGQGRILNFKKNLALRSTKGTPLIAVGDPTMLDFEILPNPRMIRLTGLRAGVTDLSITTADSESYVCEVHVTYDLTLLEAQLKQLFPDAQLRLAQLREHVVVEGEARSIAQVARIQETITAYIGSAQVPNANQSRGAPPGAAIPPGAVGQPRLEPLLPPPAPTTADGSTAPATPPPPPQPEAGEDLIGRPNARVTFPKPHVINLIRVPGVQQVLLKVRIAELNRSALREVGADLLKGFHNGSVIGTSLHGASLEYMSQLIGGGNGGQTNTTPPTTFGIFPKSEFAAVFKVLRENGLLTILAEPNLVALSGHRANFLAGGQFPVPVPSSFNQPPSVEFKPFGVQLDFVPHVVAEDRIRLRVVPVVSSPDFTLGTTLVQGGTPVPGLNTRGAETTVELCQGQTLAIAGLLHVELSGDTSRIPGLGDLPYLGPLFSNTTHRRVEKELLVLVTPYLIEPMQPCQVPPVPGQSITDPNDCEFYFMNRIEGRTGFPTRATTDYEPFTQPRLMHYEKRHIQGPVGFSEP
jgi:pilus assembly protein CpaC